MKYEYLIFNFLVVLVPIIYSFEKRLFFISKWRFVCPALLISLPPYIIWDIIVTGEHWHFNPKYTLDFQIARLPIGEWLFFLTIPFACLFIWEVIGTYRQDQIQPKLGLVRSILGLCLPIGILVFNHGKQYTGLVLIFLSTVAAIDHQLKTNLFARTQTYIYILVIATLILLFNGYLTARPVVLYGEPYQTGVLIFTIPIEDFGYGFSLILLNTIFYEKLKEGNFAQ